MLCRYYLKKLDLIDTVPDSEQGGVLSLYEGMRVIMSRNVYNSAGIYYTYLIKSNTIKFSTTTVNYTPTELDRKPLDGYGIDQLITRRTFALHFMGTAWVDGSVSGTTPSDAEIAAAAQWNRVFDKENMPFTVLKHKIG